MSKEEKMGFQQTFRMKLQFAKLFKFKTNKNEDGDDRLSKWKKDTYNTEKRNAGLHTSDCQTHIQQGMEVCTKFYRFKGSQCFYRRRNGITEKDYIDFFRLQRRRVQQRILRTYVHRQK